MKNLNAILPHTINCVECERTSGGVIEIARQAGWLVGGNYVWLVTPTSRLERFSPVKPVLLCAGGVQTVQSLQCSGRTETGRTAVIADTAALH